MAPFQFEVKFTATISLCQLIATDERRIALADAE